jgi:hypothetical protein
MLNRDFLYGPLPTNVVGHFAQSSEVEGVNQLFPVSRRLNPEDFRSHLCHFDTSDPYSMPQEQAASIAPAIFHV